MPITYDLKLSLDTFLGEYFSQEKAHKQNYWIIKPPNMARSIDISVTNNLDCIIKLTETCPRLA